MEKFKAYLTVDDWKQTDLLPPGWFYRQKRTERGFTYLNQMFEHFRTMIAMFDHLRQEGYGEEAVERFEKGNHRIRSKWAVENPRFPGVGAEVIHMQSNHQR